MSVGPSSLMQGRVFWLPLGDDCYSNGPNLLIDGGMEAVGIAGWIQHGGGTLTKTVINVAGGKQCGHWALGDFFYRVAVGTGPAGAIYRANGYTRSDGIIIPKIQATGAGTIWIGSNSTEWQVFDVTFTPAVAFNFYPSSSTPTGYTEWDQIQVCLVNGSAIDTYGAIGTGGVTSVNNKYSYRPYLAFTSGLTATGTCTAAFNFRAVDVTNFQALVDIRGGSSNDYLTIFTHNSKLLVSSRGAPAYSKHSSVIVNNQWYRVLIAKTTGQTQNIYINGIDVTVPATASITQPTSYTIGMRSYGSYMLDGDMSNVGIWDRTLTDAEIQYDYNQNRMR